jgi:cytochrome P450
MLITTDPDLFRLMSAVRSPFTRGPWYAALKLHPERDNITSYVDEAKHTSIRNRMAPGYSGKENPHMESDIDAKLLQMFALIQNKYLAKPEEGTFRTVDLSRVTSFFTLDVISKIAFGQPFGFLDNDADPFGYLANLMQFLPAIIVFGVYTELTNIMKMRFIKPLLPSSSDPRGLGRVMGFARDRVAERFGSTPLVREDMLASFIKRGLTQDELESETLTQITAGSDSTASALRITLHFVSTCPPVLAKLLHEVREAIAEGKVSRPVISDVEARRLPYLQACIKEGLRIYPPVTGLMAKQVPPGGAVISVDGTEKFAPGGTQIGWNSWGMMHDKHIFGADADVFRPERWLGEKEVECVTRMNETVALCFGSGRFGCLGRGVAVMELNKGVVEVSPTCLFLVWVWVLLTCVIAQTLLRFNLQPCSIAKPFDEQVVGFYVHTNMNFVVTERKGVEEESEVPRSGTGSGSEAFDAAALPGAPVE